MFDKYKKKPVISYIKSFVKYICYLSLWYMCTLIFICAGGVGDFICSVYLMQLLVFVYPYTCRSLRIVLFSISISRLFSSKECIGQYMGPCGLCWSSVILLLPLLNTKCTRWLHRIHVPIKNNIKIRLRT